MAEERQKAQERQAAEARRKSEAGPAAAGGGDGGGGGRGGEFGTLVRPASLVYDASKGMAPADGGGASAFAAWLMSARRYPGQT
jgi:hypothetical protein